MKKVFAVMFLVVMAVCVLSGCGSERKGVPDAIVYSEVGSNFEYIGVTDYEISHDVDTTTHIDTVTASGYIEGDYGTGTEYVVLQYQYDRASDLWELLDSSDWEYEFEPNEKNLVGEWYWENEAGYTSSAAYMYLTIHEIKGNLAVVSYEYSDEWENLNAERMQVELMNWSRNVGHASLKLDRNAVPRHIHFAADGVHEGLDWEKFVKIG